jgi:transcriptional regulator with XRE-family HTH domain
MNIYEERIAPLFTQTGKNDKELETIIGLPKGIIYNWKSGRSKNFEAYIPQISKYFHISADYLMGIDTPKSPAEAEGIKEAYDPKSEGEDAQLAQLIAGFNRLSPQQKSAVLAVIEGYQPSQE